MQRKLKKFSLCSKFKTGRKMNDCDLVDIFNICGIFDLDMDIYFLIDLTMPIPTIYMLYHSFRIISGQE